MAFVRHSFEMMEPQQDGATARDHLMAAWRMSGEQPQQLAEAPELPPGCAMLWSDFWELHGERGSNGFGPSRITRRDIREWQQDSRVRLEAWERAAIRQADDLWLSEFAPKPKETAN